MIGVLIVDTKQPTILAFILLWYNMSLPLDVIPKSQHTTDTFIEEHKIAANPRPQNFPLGAFVTLRSWRSRVIVKVRQCVLTSIERRILCRERGGFFGRSSWSRRDVGECREGNVLQTSYPYTYAKIDVW